MTAQTPGMAAVVARLERVRRKAWRLALAICVIVWMLLVSPNLVLVGASWAAEKVVPRMFKNTDEAVGWLKAKGKCEGSGGVVSCEAEVELPKKGSDGKEISPGWHVWGYWKVIETSGVRFLYATIVRSRRFSLSPKDSFALVDVRSDSVHGFGRDGVKIASKNRVSMTNYKGEDMLDLMIPWTEHSLPLREAGEDYYLLGYAFGAGWNFITLP